MSRKLETLTDSQLVKLYRKSGNDQKENILDFLLYEKKNGRKSWYYKILSNIIWIKSKLDIEYLDEDLRKEIEKKFQEILEVSFEIGSSYGFSFYAHKAINSVIFSSISDVDLVRLYRNSNNIQKERIFKYLLYEKIIGKKTWYQKITTHVMLNKAKLKLDLSCTEEDLIEEAVKAFHKTLYYWFDLKSPYGFSTYVWRTIDSSVNRVFQNITKTKKRNFEETIKTEGGNKIKKKRRKIEINDVYSGSYNDAGLKKWEDVISSENKGNYKTEKFKASFEQIILYRDIIKHLKDSLKEEVIDAPEELILELGEYIKSKNANVRVLRCLASKYGINSDDVIKIREKVISNIERSMFRDFIILIENDLKNYEDLEQKYSCSRAHLIKQKDKMSEKFMKKLYKLNLPFCELFEGS